MGVAVGTAAVLAAALASPAADASERRLGVDHRQSGLDAAFVPDPPKSDLDRWRAHLAVDLVGWVRHAPWPREGSGPVGPSDGIGVPGGSRFALGFGIGHGFADRLVVGLNLEYEATRGLQRTAQEPESDPRAMGFSAMPYVEVMLVRKAMVRPYVSARLGIGGSTVTSDGSSPAENRPGDALSLLYPSFGLGLGAHGFVTREVSIDGSVHVDHRWEFARLPGPLPDPAQVQLDDVRHNAFGRRFTATLVFGVSRWF